MNQFRNPYMMINSFNSSQALGKGVWQGIQTEIKLRCFHGYLKNDGSKKKGSFSCSWISADVDKRVEEREVVGGRTQHS